MLFNILTHRRVFSRNCVSVPSAGVTVSYVIELVAVETS
jgi:hypothetical protein